MMNMILYVAVLVFVFGADAKPRLRSRVSFETMIGRFPTDFPSLPDFIPTAFPSLPEGPFIVDRFDDLRIGDELIERLRDVLPTGLPVDDLLKRLRDILPTGFPVGDEFLDRVKEILPTGFPIAEEFSGAVKDILSPDLPVVEDLVKKVVPRRQFVDGKLVDKLPIRSLLLKELREGRLQSFDVGTVKEKAEDFVGSMVEYVSDASSGQSDGALDFFNGLKAAIDSFVQAAPGQNITVPTEYVGKLMSMLNEVTQDLQKVTKTDLQDLTAGGLLDDVAVVKQRLGGLRRFSSKEE